MHDTRLRRHGDVDVVLSPRGPVAPELRFFAKVEWSDVGRYGGTRCLEWTAYRAHGGYGQFQLAVQRPVRAHRWLYERWVGPIPDGLSIDHLCRNPPCVNPAHLEAVTLAENNRRAALVRPPWTTCRSGHDVTGSNGFDAHGGVRRCRTCVAANNKRWYERRKAAMSNVPKLDPLPDGLDAADLRAEAHDDGIDDDLHGAVAV
jgi:hypothetical protein